MEMGRHIKRLRRKYMNTTNLISTPDITGNIGSCTTKTEKVVISSNPWRSKGTTIATNSCTGVVEKYDYYSISGFSCFITGVMLLIAFGIWASSRD